MALILIMDDVLKTDFVNVFAPAPGLQVNRRHGLVIELSHNSSERLYSLVEVGAILSKFDPVFAYQKIAGQLDPNIEAHFCYYAITQRQINNPITLTAFKKPYWKGASSAPEVNIKISYDDNNDFELTPSTGVACI